MAVAAERRLKHWGWGYEDQQPPPGELREAAAGIRAHLGFEPAEVEEPVPLEEVELAALLEWCDAAGAAAIPYGGGTSVVGGVEPRVPERYEGAVSIDLHALDRVLEVDPVSRAARIQAGAPGPVLEEQLRPHGLTMRHYPQSFEFSTLGGWIATRAGGALPPP